MEAIKSLVPKKFTEPLSDTRTEEQTAKDREEAFNSSPGDLNAEEYDCAVCRNKGTVMKAVKREDSWDCVYSPCKCLKTRATIRNIKNSGLKDIIKDYTFDKFTAAEDWQKTLKSGAVKYADNPEGWFFIGGQSGAGKTHICAAICRKLLLEGKAVRYMLWRDEISKLKSNINIPEIYGPLTDELKNAEILFIDDLFKTGKADNGSRQRPTSADINTAFEILNYRYCNSKLPTVISSECTINDIIDIDEALSGRIFEKAGVNAFNISPDRGKNYRLKKITEL